MKYTDVQKLLDAGLITGDQRERIIQHYNLKEEGSRFLAIISTIGAVLVTAGIILLISAHWNEIPRGIKITTGLALMLGAHAGGWWLREVHGKYRKSGEALHLIGAGLFLGNIALLGQTYNLVSRPPNAILLWWLGIAALPWVLRSKALHVLVLLAFGLWFGLEVNEPDSLLFCGNDERQLLLYAFLGLIYLCSGYCLRRTRQADFSGITEKIGILGLLIFSYPMTWKEFFTDYNAMPSHGHQWLLPALAVLAAAFLIFGVSGLKTLSRQWRVIWSVALAALCGMLATVYYELWQTNTYETISYMPGVLVLFIFCLLQIQVGLQERSPFLVNVGITFIALDIIAAYLDLFGSMARTGLMFLISGVFLIAFGVYLEKKRRKLVPANEIIHPSGGPMKLKLLILVLALQSAWMLYTVATQEYGLATGPTALLETRPVDPRDLLRGDYLTLRYNISDVDTNLFVPPLSEMLPAGEVVYVAIAKKGQYHEATRAATNRFEPAPGELLLEGRSGWSWRGQSNTHPIHVNFGIEQYFVPEGQGNPHGKLTVQIAIPASHRPMIKELFVDGKPFAETIKNQP